jgi:hypothetical protein
MVSPLEATPRPARFDDRAASERRSHRISTGSLLTDRPGRSNWKPTSAPTSAGATVPNKHTVSSEGYVFVEVFIPAVSKLGI